MFTSPQDWRYKALFWHFNRGVTLFCSTALSSHPPAVQPYIEVIFQPWMSFPERPGSQIRFCSLDSLNLDSWQEMAEKSLFLSGWAGNTFRRNSNHNCFSMTCLPPAHAKLDLPQAPYSEPGQVKMVDCLGLLTASTASNVASRLQYSPTLPVPLLVTTCLLCPLRLLLFFPAGEGWLGWTNESQGLTG